ncbi:ester cyclase [Pseudomonas sp. KSR10]|jgi:predicted ester cyclase|uniref:ester cyclase n=1 Tax=Pseudomonas sp. KSR10 TaxID=2916654 RepID=UPI001EF7C7F9|nr:ester cyclase [Pseudomonas sp. KSR10]MCG6542095.1 ester cyclase [Pseudomonas sp. KSR10]
MTGAELTDCYRGYIACLNSQNWPELGRFVDNEVQYNGQRVGLDGYRRMLEEDFLAIPDLHFNIALLTVEPPHVACRLLFDCTPAGTLFGFPVNGKRVAFSENVFYEFQNGKIRHVWSVIDKAAVGAQV